MTTQTNEVRKAIESILRLADKERSANALYALANSLDAYGATHQAKCLRKKADKLMTPSRPTEEWA